MVSEKWKTLTFYIINGASLYMWDGKDKSQYVAARYSLLIIDLYSSEKFVWFQLSANDDLFRTFWCSFMADVQWYNTSERSKVPYRSTCLQPYPNGGISIIITYFKGICIIFYNNYYKVENEYFYNNYIQHIWPCNIMYFYNSSHSILFHSEISLVAKVIFYI